MLTIGKLKQKLNELEIKGIINDDTVVCGYNDEFMDLYALDEHDDIVLSIQKDIDECKNMIEYYKNCDASLDKIKDKEKEIEKLKSLGDVVVCLQR